MSDIKPEEKVEKDDILSEVKKVEKLVKAQLLIKTLSDVKKKAREIVELKEETDAILEEIGLSAEDAKRVIDYVNSLKSVQLSESDKKEIREDTKKTVENMRESAEKKIEEKSFIPHIMSSSVLTTTNTKNCSGDIT